MIVLDMCSFRQGLEGWLHEAVMSETSSTGVLLVARRLVASNPNIKEREAVSFLVYLKVL